MTTTVRGEGMRIKKHLFAKTWNVAIFSAVLFSLCETAMARSYLQELENEAASSNNQEQSGNTTEEKPSWTPDKASLVEKIDPGLSKGQFEEELKSRFYGSYLFYSSLNSNKQDVVYEEYLKNNDIEHLRETIKNQMSD